MFGSELGEMKLRIRIQLVEDRILNRPPLEFMNLGSNGGMLAKVPPRNLYNVE